MPLLVIFLALCLQVFLTSRKVSPFLSLLIVGLLAGLFLGMEPMALAKSVERGVSNTLGGVALVIFLGAILGKIMEAGGAAERISSTLIRAFGEKHIQWAILLTGFLIGIPLYYNAGFVILVPLVFTIAHRAKMPLLYLAIPMAASLSVTHCFLPPHPSPVFLVNAFKADMGKTLIYGLIIALPVLALTGPVLGRWLRGMKVNLVSSFLSVEPKPADQLPGALPSFLIGLLPVLLISGSVIAENFLAEGWLRKVLLFTGDTTIALLISVCLAIWYFGIRPGKTMEATMKWVQEAISGIAMIVLIITAGGVLKQILQDSGTDQYIAAFCSRWEMHPLLFGWLITAVLRVSIGSATVAGLTAAGVVTPLVASGVVAPEMMVLAIGTGSVFGSHVNDSGFWMFKEFFNLTMKQTFLSWTVMETLISVLGITGILILNSIVNP